MNPDRVPTGDLGPLADDRTDLFEQAQQALRLFVGAYTARIDWRNWGRRAVAAGCGIRSV
jgi:hypothetical protein